MCFTGFYRYFGLVSIWSISLLTCPRVFATEAAALPGRGNPRPAGCNKTRGDCCMARSCNIIPKTESNTYMYMNTMYNLCG